MTSGPPLAFVLGGPNGAGKSTAASVLIPTSIPFLNADEIAKTLPGYPSRATDLEAGRELLRQIGEMEDARRGFAVESTLAGVTLATRLAKLRSLGYATEVLFLWTPSPEFSIRRVAERVRMGGHSVPDEVDRRRYHAGLDNFFRVYLPVTDVWRVYHNIGVAGFGLIAEQAAGSQVKVFDASIWNEIGRKVPGV